MESPKTTSGPLFQALTYDALLHVLSYLRVVDLGRLGRVSRCARDFADDEMVWRSRCRTLEHDWRKILRDPASQHKDIVMSGLWKHTFRAERQRLTEISKFVGLWSEKWCDVHVVQSTQIETNGKDFIVSYKKNKFSAKFLNFDGESLSFHLEGGDSGWAFIYTLKSIAENVLQLSVFRVHDKKTFAGFYTRT
jgi:hypothetical protein